MSDSARDVAESMERLSFEDPTLKCIDLGSKESTDSELSDFIDCLTAHPNVVTHLFLGGNCLTDETGVKLGQYIAVSSTIRWLDLSNNQFGTETYVHIAAALCVNSSLKVLYLFENEAVDRTPVQAAFVEALQLNPDYLTVPIWCLYTLSQNEFYQLKIEADRMDAPSALTQLDLVEECRAE